MMSSSSVAPSPTPSSSASFLTPEAFARQLQQHLEQLGVWTPGRKPRYLLAYSGGVDSTALLHGLAVLRNQNHIELAAATYHHGWRGTPAPELPRIHKTTTQLRVPLVWVPPEPTEKRNETQAREHRYRKLAVLAHQLKADAVLTAHHCDDQLETLLFRLFRGTGLDGLEGIRGRLDYPVTLPGQPSSVVKFVRPLLTVRKAALQAYAQQQELGYFEDPTNEKRKHARNAIRHDILPAIRQQFPHAETALLRLSEVARGDQQVLDAVTQEQWQRLAKPSPQAERVQLEVAPLAQLTRPYQRRVLRYWLKYHQLPQEFAQVERLADFLSGAHRFRKKNPQLALETYAGQPVTLAQLEDNLLKLVVPSQDSQPQANLVTTADRDASWQAATAIALPQEAMSSPDHQQWPIPGREDWYLHLAPLSEADWPDAKSLDDVLPSPKSLEIWVHLQPDLIPNLMFRLRQTGDRIQPLGLPRATRLKRYLINQKVPSTVRQQLWMLASEADILWIPGLTVSEALWVDDQRPPTHRLWLGPLVEVTTDAEEQEDSDEEGDNPLRLSDEESELMAGASKAMSAEDAEIISTD